MNTKKLFLTWQNQKTRSWFSIGMLTFEDYQPIVDDSLFLSGAA